MDRADRLVIGLVPSDRLRARDPRTRAFVRAVGERAGIYLVERNVSSYEELEREMTLARIDVAWLPPLVFARLERGAIAAAVATRVEARDTYSSVLVAAASSGISGFGQLPGRRIAWVDPLSAAGYVLPRLGLFARGIDPARTFSLEFFAGSHAEAMRALRDGRADVAATFAHLDIHGFVARGAWSEIGVSGAEIRIIAMFGQIPLDLVAALTTVASEEREALGRALIEMGADPEMGPVVESVFGCRRFERGTSASYAALRGLLDAAADPALGWATQALVSTAPPLEGGDFTEGADRSTPSKR